MTLETAKAAFSAKGSREAAADLLTVATRDWNREAINDEAFADCVRLVRDWLLKTA